MDYAVRVWDLQGSVCLAVLNEAHTQPVTAIRCLDNHVLMAARDCFVTCWNLPKEKPAEIKRIRTIPVDEVSATDLVLCIEWM
jgi:WD40 repeat protein